MNTIAFVCLATVCLALGIINTIFNKLVGWKGIVIRGLFVLSLITFNLITANLRGINSALPLFITLALACILLAEAVLMSMSEEEKLKPVANGTFFAISCILFALSGVSLSEFAILGLLGGLFAGAGVGLIICAIKKEKALNPILMNILTFACVGLLVGLGISGVLNTKHMTSAICVLIGGLLLLAYRIIFAVGGKGKMVCYITNALNALGLIALTITVYFF